MLMNEGHPQPPLALDEIDSKCPLADDLQLAPRCHNTEDDATLAKSFIILLEGTTANWHARLQPRSPAHGNTSEGSS
jgi:hypothetical protein